jgi:hypothetical protein
MRIMEIPGFRDHIEITDLLGFYMKRLAGIPESASSTASLLLGYMGWPNDQAARGHATVMIQDWVKQGGTGPLPPGLRTMQQHWARAADIVHLHHDMTEGDHQERRGGASVSKAVHLLAKVATSKGTGQARLWDIWKEYKDVAPLVAAAVIVVADMKERHKRTPLIFELRQLLPFRVTLLMPELIIGLGITIQRYGLQVPDLGQSESIFDPRTLWRIPEDINVAPVPMLSRKLRREDVVILNARRAGNRGKFAA